MLEVARANVDRLGVDNIELAEGDVADPAPARSCGGRDGRQHGAAPGHQPRGHARRDDARHAAGGWVAITDEIEHPYEWMRTEHADVWLGFSSDQIEGFFGDARLSTTATPHLAPSETSTPLRSKSQTSASSSLGVGCPHSERSPSPWRSRLRCCAPLRARMVVWAGARANQAQARAKPRPCQPKPHEQRRTDGANGLFDGEAADMREGHAGHWKISVVQSPPWRRTSWARAGPPGRSWKSTKKSGSISMPPSAAQLTRSSHDRSPG
jgi:hypothetical protein